MHHWTPGQSEVLLDGPTHNVFYWIYVTWKCGSGNGINFIIIQELPEDTGPVDGFRTFYDPDQLSESNCLFPGIFSVFWSLCWETKQTLGQWHMCDVTSWRSWTVCTTSAGPGITSCYQYWHQEKMRREKMLDEACLMWMGSSFHSFGTAKKGWSPLSLRVVFC